MDSQTIAQLTHTLQTVAIATLFFAICAYVPKLKRKAQLGSLPALGSVESGEKHRKTYLTSAKDMYAEGYAKVSYS
jgi:hypothetical protein